MDKKMVNVLAGMFSCTNIGLPMPSVDDVAWAKKNMANHSHISMMEHFCGSYIESDEMEELFRAEADSWHVQLSEMSEDQARSIWPDAFETYDKA